MPITLRVYIHLEGIWHKGLDLIYLWSLCKAEIIILTLDLEVWKVRG
jgi:hypothetical protein